MASVLTSMTTLQPMLVLKRNANKFLMLFVCRSRKHLLVPMEPLMGQDISPVNVEEVSFVCWRTVEKTRA